MRFRKIRQVPVGGLLHLRGMRIPCPLVLPLVMLMSCTAPDPADRQPAADLPGRAAGHYTGTNLLWFRGPEPLQSPAEVHVEGDEVRYTWEYEGQPQSGVLPFRFEGDQVSVTWSDTWHARKAITCQGSRTPGKITVVGTYGAGDQVWSWRTEFSAPAADQVLMEMFNIHPDGQEDLAVRLTATRSS